MWTTIKQMLVISVLAGSVPQAHGDDATTSEQSAILAVVMQLFDGMRDKNADLIRSAFAEGATLGTSGVEAFVTAVTQSEAYLNEVTFDETVLIDGDLAMAWTPYNLFVDGGFHHCGVDLFIFKRSLEGRWLIHTLEDTRRKENCDEARGR